jgi:signal transduction histidine kinase
MQMQLPFINLWQRLKEHFYPLSIRSKVLLPLICLQFLVIFGLTYSLYILDQHRQAIEVRSQQLRLVNTLSNKIGVIHKRIQYRLLLHHMNPSTTLAESIRRNDDELMLLLEQMERIVPEGEDEYLKEFGNQYIRLRPLREALMDSIERNDQQEIISKIARWAVLSENSIAALDDMISYNLIQYGEVAQYYQSNLDRLYRSIVVISLSTILALLFLYYYLFRIITRPVAKLSNMMRLISMGNYKVTSKLHYGDELGRLGELIMGVAHQLDHYYETLNEKIRIQKKLLEKSREVQKRKDEFISIASHELKTPLTSIKIYIQLLERALETDGKDAGTYVKKAKTYVERINTLIADLLDVSKIQAGRLALNPSEFAFDSLIQHSVAEMQMVTKQHLITVQGETKVTVNADKERLEQVMTNLLSNAIKYSPEADKIEVSVGTRSKKAFVEVRDYGIGINRDHQRKIFERFYRVQESSDHFSGLGIGLYISDEIIQRHGGRIGLRHRKGPGSTFYFEIPYQKK